MPDVSAIPEAVWPELSGLKCWILDALRRTPHPSHTHLEQSLEWIERAAPEMAVLTNMHVDLDYDAVEAETGDTIKAAFDGMRLTF